MDTFPDFTKYEARVTAFAAPEAWMGRAGHLDAGEVSDA
jgi:hypothetical protein